MSTIQNPIPGEAIETKLSDSREWLKARVVGQSNIKPGLFFFELMNGGYSRSDACQTRRPPAPQTVAFDAETFGGIWNHVFNRGEAIYRGTASHWVLEGVFITGGMFVNWEGLRDWKHSATPQDPNSWQRCERIISE